MGSPIISIIVPVYNVEKYLRKCINSILSQTFSDFELILVDDGSPDSCGEICDEYAQEDNRVIVIHKMNGGLSSARNAGLDIARGQYIGFVDSDDYIHEEMYQVLMNNLLKEQADISMCGLYDCYQGKTPAVLQNGYFVVDSEKAVEIVLKAKITAVTAVNKLYKASIFAKLRYPIGKQAEDAFVIVDVLIQCKCVVITTEQLYYYYHRENSITTKKFSDKDLDVIYAHERNMKLINQYFPNLCETAQMRLCWARFLVLDKILLSGQEKEYQYTDEIIKYLKKNVYFILKNEDFRFTRKIAMLALLIHVRIYKVVVRLYQKKSKPNFC